MSLNHTELRWDCRNSQLPSSAEAAFDPQSQYSSTKMGTPYRYQEADHRFRPWRSTPQQMDKRSRFIAAMRRESRSEWASSERNRSDDGVKTPMATGHAISLSKEVRMAADGRAPRRMWRVEAARTVRDSRRL